MNREFKNLVCASLEVREHILHEARFGYENLKGQYITNWKHSDPEGFRLYKKLNKALIPFLKENQ